MSRQSVHAWLARYRAGGLAGLADRPSRPRSSPNQASARVEARVCELRRAHPRWGALRIVHELMRGPAPPEPLPSRATVHRILVRHGLVITRPRRRKPSDYVRWQRPAAMQLWQLDIVYGPRLVDTVTGELREARIVTGVDDHSRFCVLARVVERATGRAICLAFAEALERYGAPEEVLTDNGKQFTGRFGRGGEVLFDKICRRNGIAHRLTAPSSPTTTGKIERFHQTLRRELLDQARPFTSLLEAQAALDDWVREYNAERPHQALETRAPVTPAERFQPAPAEQRELLPIWLPGALVRRPGADGPGDRGARPRRRRRARSRRAGGGRVRSRRPAVGEPVDDAPAVLARPAARRPDRPLLGRRRRHPPLDRRRPRQEPALAPERRRPGPARPARARSRPVRRRSRSSRRRGGDRGRPRGQQQRPGLARPAARCSPPRSSAGAP